MEPMAKSFLIQLWNPILFTHCVKEVVSHIDTFGWDFKPLRWLWRSNVCCSVTALGFAEMIRMKCSSTYMHVVIGKARCTSMQ
jgi:hypothetical protein